MPGWFRLSLCSDLPPLVVRASAFAPATLGPVLANVLLVAVGGAAGAVARYGVSYAVLALTDRRFPYATLAVNVAGCLLIGLLMQWAVQRASLAAPWRLFLVTGFLGAFTTFSTMGYETFDLLRHGRPDQAILSVAANVALGLPAVWLGWALGRAVGPAPAV